jgi:hypothetical protein
MTVCKKEQEEEPYWEWKKKQQQIYLSPPVYLAHPRSARTKKVLPPINNQANQEVKDEDGLIFSKPVLPDLESEDEEEKDPLKKLSRKLNKDELERKDRWIVKFETESREVNEKSIGAINRAERCISSINKELNEQESSYSKYKTAVEKLDETCKNKIKRINNKERSMNRFVYGRSKPNELDRTFAQPTWPNQGWTYSRARGEDEYNDIYLKNKPDRQSKSMNKTVCVEKPRRAVSNARPVDRLP